MKLSERDAKVIWHPYSQVKTDGIPIGITHGKGAYLYDESGKRYMDAVSSWWVNVHGHAHPHISKKISEQLEQLEHVIFSGFTHAPAIELAEKLLKLLPQNQSRIFFSDNGSTAVEAALKMSLQYFFNKNEKRNKIIAFDAAYHGDTFGSMSVSADSAFTKPFSDLLFNVIRIPYPKTGEEQKSLDSLLSAIQDDTVAAFIFEPLVLGASGMLMYSAEVLTAMLKICRSKGVISIADEVMTGFGRTGKMFACDYLDEMPDIVCLSKGITGGYLPLGVTSCTHELFNAFLDEDRSKMFFHGHSYTGNPLSCAAANASLEIFEWAETKDGIDRIIRQHKNFSDHEIFQGADYEVRQCGTILAIEIKEQSGRNYFSALRNKAYDFFISKGIILRPLGNVLYIMPPYCTSAEDLEYIYENIVHFLKIEDEKR